ncbi:MAG: type II toxin-antitoxin system prevent-host-death family antitoxin [Streptosporangiaceae bacterium]|nr:type II toxin-antitoxin system prevent-host-death family antitoxin [Streptosporangiaceae bacterium]MBV9855281.1 type II toxin-antitoxin system prevent-host-death family antitoxin [Streptosporangiaceae bacterium]
MDEGRGTEDDTARLPASTGRGGSRGRAGRPAGRAAIAEPPAPGENHRIGIRELRQHASVYVDLAERGYTVDITNRGRLVAQLVPARQPDSPLERWIAAGVIQEADEPGDILDIEPAPPVPPGQPGASETLRRTRDKERY